MNTSPSTAAASSSLAHLLAAVGAWSVSGHSALSGCSREGLAYPCGCVLGVCLLALRPGRDVPENIFSKSGCT